MKSHTLLEVSKITGIKINAIRYHIKKMKAQFEHLKRDRYNRFRFTNYDIQKLQNIHEMKDQGYDYGEIQSRLSGNPLDSHNVHSQPMETVSESRWEEFEHRLKQQDQSLENLEKKLDSLEERLEMLIDLHTEKLLED